MDSIDRIIELMDERQMTAIALTNGANLSNGLITQWKQRKQKPSIDQLVKIANYFDVSLDYLAGRTDVREVNKQKKLSSLSEEQLHLLYEITLALSAASEEKQLEVLEALKAGERPQSSPGSQEDAG